MSKFIGIISSPKFVFLIIPILFWVFTLPLLKRLVPLHLLVKLMLYKTVKRTFFNIEINDLLYIIQRIYYSSEGRCLERSLLLYRYLKFYGKFPELIIGLRKSNSEWTGHAWVEINKEPLAENNNFLNELKPTLKFDSHGNLQKL
jgi:hypothetical protein